MAANKRTKQQREFDLERIAALYLQGKSQRVIGEVVKLSRQQVTYDLKDIQQRWRDSSVRNFNEARSQELAKIDNLEREYWEAWERSVGLKERSVRETKTGDNQFNREQVITFEEAGDPRFLQGVQWCIEKRTKLLGLDAPLKFAPTDPTGKEPYREVPADEVQSIVGLYLEAIERASTLCVAHDAGG